MTFKEIFVNEDINTQTVWLHLEGTFLRAHNQSAYLLCRSVHDPLKVSLKFIKKENREDFSVGFPESVKNRWLHGRELHVVPDSGGRLFWFTVDRPLTEVEYENWCDEVRKHHQGGKIVTRLTRLVNSQPVWKISYDIFMEVLSAVGNVSTRMRFLGEDAARQAHALCLGVTHFYDASDRVLEASRLRDLCTDLALTLYVLQQKREISSKCFCENAERLAALRGNLGRLSKAKAAKADGAPAAKAAVTSEGFLESLMKSVDPSDDTQESAGGGPAAAQ